MRTIGKNVINEVTITDPIGGGDVKLYYRTPTTNERQQYTSSLFQTKGRKVKTMISGARQKFGQKILTGFRHNDFCLVEEDGRKVAFASDPKDPQYRENWKDLVVESAADLVETLAFHVFEGAKVMPDDDENDEIADDGDEIPN